MPDNIWYNDYQIVKVNPAIEIEGDMIVDLGDIDEFKKFVKTKSADCHFVTYANQNRKLISKQGKRIPIPSYAMAVPAMFDGSSFDPKYFIGDDVTEQKIFHTRHPARKKFCGGRPGSPLYCNINGTKKLFGLRSYQGRACGSEQGWWNPAPVVKFIADNTDYDDPSTGRSAKPSAKPVPKTTTKQVKTTKQSSTARRPPSILSQLENETSENYKTDTLTMRWSKANKTTTDPTCDAFCQHQYKLCTFVGVNPPLYGCVVIDHAKYLGKYAPPGVDASTGDGVKPSYSGSTVKKDQTSKDTASGNKLTFEGGTEKTWDAKTYKTATPSCADYCEGKDQRCTFVNFNPLAYGCKAKLGSSSKLKKPETSTSGGSSSSSSSSPSSGDKTWTKETYKTADPNCSDYCTKKDMRCSFVNLKPLTYGCKEKFGSSSFKKPSTTSKTPTPTSSSKPTSTQSTSTPSTASKPSDGRKTFEKLTDCSKECSKYKLKCARADGKWQCEQAKKKLNKETKEGSNDAKSVWEGKEITDCFKTCRASGKKCTRMKTGDPSIRKYHCSNSASTSRPSATSSGSSTKSKPSSASSSSSTPTSKSTTKPSANTKRPTTTTAKPRTTSKSNTTTKPPTKAEPSTKPRTTAKPSTTATSGASSTTTSGKTWEGKTIGDCFKTCKASGKKCTRMKIGDTSVRKYHCSDSSFSKPTTRPTKSPKSSGSSSSGSSSSSTPGSKQTWEGKNIGDCFKSCKASGKKCTRMKTGDPSVRKYHCIDSSNTSSSQSSSESSSRSSGTSAAKPSTTTTKSSGSSEDKTWTRENYKTAEPNCNDYCTKKDMRCSFVNLKPITYGCKPKFKTFSKSKASTTSKSKYEGKTWTIKDYKTADPTCKDYCTEKDKTCRLVIFKPKLLYGCK